MTHGSLSCPLCCRQKYSTVEALREHLLYFAYRPLPCPVCNENITGLQLLVRHLDTHLEPLPNCSPLTSSLIQDISLVLPSKTRCGAKPIDTLETSAGIPSKSNMVQLDLISIQNELSSENLNKNSLHNKSYNSNQSSSGMRSSETILFNQDLSSNSTLKNGAVSREKINHLQTTHINCSDYQGKVLAKSLYIVFNIIVFIFLLDLYS